MEENFDNNLKNLIKSLNTIYLALIAGLIMLFAIIGLFHLQGKILVELDKEMDYIFNTSTLLLTIIAIPLGYYIFSSKGKHCQTEKNPQRKLDLYKSGIIIKYASFELAGLINLVVFAMTKSQQSLLIFIVVIIVFLINRPGVNNYYENFEN